MRTFSRRNYLKLALGSFIISLTGFSHAQDNYPNKPIKLVFPLAAGTGGDMIARVVAEAMSPILGQAVIVENRVGAGGVIGTDYVAKSPADGYTLVLGTIGAIILNPELNPNVTYKVSRDFAPIAYLGHTGFVVVTAPQSGIQSLGELIGRLKQGNGNFSSVGAGTALHLATELFLKRAQVKATHIPYRGSSQSLTDVASGEVMFTLETPAAALPLIKAGKLRALAVTTTNRMASLPAVPSVKESGLPDYEATAWWGMLAPAGTPPAVIKKLSDAAVTAVNQSNVKDRFAGMGAEASPLPAPEFAKVIERDRPLWGQLIKELDLKTGS